MQTTVRKSLARGFNLRTLISAAMLLLSNLGFAQEEKITVDISGINVERGGNLVVLVFSREGFPIKHEKALATRTQAVSGERMTFTFDAFLHDELAFKVLHDEDSNHKVTKNWTGIWPREGLGFSNGAAMSTGGPPDFNAAQLSRGEAINGVKMRVIYP
ncbi:MAG: DUF2141 domain-containing protein [Gallionella sp.]|nr:DUF2141 domain-containing protein [Gallionella sp.]